LVTIKAAAAAIGLQPHFGRASVTQSVNELTNRIGFRDLEGNGELTVRIQGDGDLLVVTRIGSKPSLGICDGFFVGAPMNYQAFTNESLTMMYEATRGALAADDAVECEGGEPKFKVRDTPEWKKHAADLEAEMLRRGMLFDVIDWFEGQGSLPFDK
jgi:hypothetical protein